MKPPAPGAHVVVVGGGTMGAGIALAMQAISCSVTVVESDTSAADATRVKLKSDLLRRFKRDPNAVEQVDLALRDLDVRVGLPGGLAPALVVEAVPEIVALKLAVLADIEAAYPDLELLASNTSSLSISDLASQRVRPDRFLGMHFFNPVSASLLIEIVVGRSTSPVAVDAAQRWVSALRKDAIVVQDSPGFATSRLGVALGLEAIRMLEAGVASAEDIDRGMVLGYKHPIGPLRLTDLVGLDVRLGIAEHLAATLGQRFEPPALLRQMVDERKLGKKTGEGFYKWA